MKRFKVLVSLITRDNDYQLEQEAVAQATAQALNIDAQVIYAEKDAVNQSLQLVNAIQSSTSRPDAIIVEPVGTGMPLVAEAAARAGIGWVVLNANIDYIGKIRALGSPAAYCVNCDDDQVRAHSRRAIQRIAQSRRLRIVCGRAFDKRSLQKTNKRNARNQASRYCRKNP